MHLPLLLCLLVPSGIPSATLRADYDRHRSELELERRYLSDALQDAGSRSGRAEVVAFARQVLLQALDQALVPAWEGTPWSFSGTSERPGEGSIACGFFVGTLLEHAGFRVDRIALGRLASEHIAKSLAGAGLLRRYSNASAESVAAELLRSGPGLYAIGLDYHAALARVGEDGTVTLIHSTIAGQGGVMVEPLLGDNPFTHSRYRVTAALLSDRMVKRWLRGETFEARAE